MDAVIMTDGLGKHYSCVEVHHVLAMSGLSLLAMSFVCKLHL